MWREERASEVADDSEDGGETRVDIEIIGCFHANVPITTALGKCLFLNADSV